MRKGFVKKLFLIITGLALLLTIGGFIVYLFQDKLLFIPVGRNIRAEQKIKDQENIEKIKITTEDNINLDGWLIKANHSPAPLLIYFAGNAEEISGEAESFQKNISSDWHIALINYRGYGASQGYPTEKNLVADGVTIYDHLISRPDINPEKIVLFGRSLGSGVAVQVAAQRPVAGIILATPYDSIKKVAENLLPIVPMAELFKFEFNSLDFADSITTTALFIIAQKDQIIFPSRSMKLAENWGGEKKIIVIDNAFHYNINIFENYWENINNFLDEL